jgi:hypothetical protein
MIEQKIIILSYAKNVEIIVPGILEIKRLSDEFGIPPLEYAHYPYEMKYWVEEEKAQKFHLGSFQFSMDKKPQLEDFQLVPLPPHIAQFEKNQFRMKELIYLTNILSEHHFFQYSHAQQWFIEVGKDNEAKWGQSTFSPKGEIRELTTKSLGINDADKTVLTLTAEANEEKIEVSFADLMTTYLNSDQKEYKDTIHQVIRTFSKSLEVSAINWNASYLFFYSVLESLAEEENKNTKNKNCSECGQMTFSVSKKLKSLLDKYCYNISNKEKNKLYDFRSKIVHKGQMLPCTNDHKTVMETQEDLNALYYSNLSREYFVWLKKITQLTTKSYIYQNLTAPNTVYKT